MSKIDDMKRFIIIFLFTMVFITVNSQNYKSLASFGNDVTKYITYNFQSRTDVYKGKTVKDVINDNEVHITYYKVSYNPQSPHYHLCLFFDTNTDFYSGSYQYI